MEHFQADDIGVVASVISVGADDLEQPDRTGKALRFLMGGQVPLVAGDDVHDEHRTGPDGLEQRFAVSLHIRLSVAGIRPEEFPAVPHVGGRIRQCHALFMLAHIEIELGQLLNGPVP